jgi:hypothetical protein
VRLTWYWWINPGIEANRMVPATFLATVPRKYLPLRVPGTRHVTGSTRSSSAVESQQYLAALLVGSEPGKRQLQRARARHRRQLSGVCIRQRRQLQQASAGYTRQHTGTVYLLPYKPWNRGYEQDSGNVSYCSAQEVPAAVAWYLSRNGWYLQ